VQELSQNLQDAGAGGVPGTGLILGLQRTVGNAAVSALLPRTPRRGGAVVQRQPATAAPPTAASVAAEATAYLDNMASYVRAAEQTAAFDLATLPAGAPGAQRRRQILNRVGQEHVSRYLRQASSTYNAQLAGLPENDAARPALRAAYVKVLAAICSLSSFGLRLAEGMDAAVRDAEQVRYAENQAAWIEASPMTSTGLAGTTAFGATDTATAARYERELEGYLDDMLARAAGLHLDATQRDRMSTRIEIALRRAFVTVAAGPDGRVDVRTIANQAIAEKYRRVVALLQSGQQNRQDMRLMTDSLPAYQLPNPVPAANMSGTAVGTVDVSQVPPLEAPSVRFAIEQAGRTIMRGNPVNLQNLIWPMTIPVRLPSGLVRRRYELIFDRASNVRAERLGGDEPRGVDNAFAALSVVDKKARLMQDFGLRGVDDRPAGPNRPAGHWSSSELDQVKAAYDRMPQGQRGALQGVAIVRDTRSGQMAGGRTEAGFAHTGANNAHDLPGPPAHPPPHIHYFDAAFASNAFSAVGAPGDAGPGGDWTLLHEVGHMQIFRATTAANAAITAANAQSQHAIQGVNTAGGQVQWGGHAAWVQARNQWNQARVASNQAVVAFNQSVTSQNANVQAQQGQRLAAAQAAAAVRDQRVQAMTAAGVPPPFVRAAQAVSSALDAMLQASRDLLSSQQQIPTFMSLANRFGFRPFTDYGGTGNDEFFAESYALFTNDPNRLSAMNRRIFQWFQAGMPMDAAWNPPAAVP
jgi:hypothetical protein